VNPYRSALARPPISRLPANEASAVTSATVVGRGDFAGSDGEEPFRPGRIRIRAGGNHREVPGSFTPTIIGAM
jgi:hypothetical protein